MTSFRRHRLLLAYACILNVVFVFVDKNAAKRAENVRYFLRERPTSGYDEVSEDEDEDFIPSNEARDSDDRDTPEHRFFVKKTRPSAFHRERKKNFCWSTKGSEVRGRRSIRTYIPTGKNEAENITTPLETWSLQGAFQNKRD